MITAEISVKTLDKEIDRLTCMLGESLLSDCYIQGAISSLDWILNGGSTPSEVYALASCPTGMPTSMPTSREVQ